MKKREYEQDEFLKSLFNKNEIKEDLGITEKVMRNIQESPDPKIIEYQPPITKRGWAIILGFFAGLMIYAVLLDSSLTLKIPDFSVKAITFFRQLENSLNWNISLIELPVFSVTYLSVILLFVVAGTYFILSNWRPRKV